VPWKWGTPTAGAGRLFLVLSAVCLSPSLSRGCVCVLKIHAGCSPSPISRVASRNPLLSPRAEGLCVMCRAAVECLVNNTFAVSPRPNLHHHRHHGRTTMLHRVADSDGTIAMPYHPMPYPCHTISYRLPGEAFGFRLSTLSGWNRNRNHTVLRVYYILYAVFPCSQKPTAGEAK